MAKERITYKRPAADFLTREPMPGVVPPPAGTWWRIAQAKYDPLYYNRSGTMRFDSPDAKLGVLYLAPSIECAMAEVFGEAISKDPPRIAEKVLTERKLYSTLIPDEIERMCPLYGENLMNLRADLASFVAKRSISQEWARELMKHPNGYQGLLYIARQGAETCLALFGDKNRPKVSFVDQGSVFDHAACLAYLDRHEVAVY